MGGSFEYSQPTTNNRDDFADTCCCCWDHSFFYVLFHALPILFRELTSPLRHMRGPKNPSLVFGNFQKMMEDPNLTDKWRNEFGATFLFKGVFGISELHTSDIKTINHIFSKSAVYQRAPFARANSSQLTGNGILSVGLDDHKHFQTPAFNVAQMRVTTEVFIEKAIQMCANCIFTRHFEVLSWLRLMTLEIIGKAGFDYDFEALVPDKKPNELNEVLMQLFHSPLSNRYATFRLAWSLVPILGLVPLPGKSLFLAAQTKMFTIGHQILARSKAAIKATDGEKDLGSKRDLLSVLLKANLSTDVPANQRLSDEELVSQIPTFFVAGHETTSTAASWALHVLLMNTAAQMKLREELLTVSTDNPTMDELNSLTYLESVIRETMRICAPVTFRHRMATQEDVLPLSKPYVDQYGRSNDSLV
ncbi:Cytochrome P450 [Mycena venus]|uniref:Cytochrome P450 n=1 Tax=Mycena venus TaxID=2733690 RepID=A0A8H6U2F1_9AGAR|nr:Cytochrome P450 [Mycena venus]